MRDLRIAAAILALAVTSGAAQAATDDLNDTQKLGRSLFVQSCGICHLKPQLNAPQFAPVLSKDTLGGQDDAVRAVIANGTPRMPGFKHHFDQDQIAAIAAYLKTVPAPAAAGPAPGARREGRDAD